MAQAEDLGLIERADDRVDVRFERHYPRPVETVWSALTEPARLADWMGASYVEPHAGGRYETMLDGLKPSSGHVLIWQPPRILEIAWSNGHAPDGIVRYDLTPEPAGTHLVFTHRGIPYRHAALMLPGWHVYLSHLSHVLAGTGPPDWEATWRQMQTIYVEHYGLHGLTLEP